MKRQLEIGGLVIYIDERRVEHNALITAIWGDPEGEKVADVPEVGQKGGINWPCVNVLYVSPNEDCQDQYGRQIERASSAVHQSDNSAAGRCYRFPDEGIRAWEDPVK